MFNGFLFFDFRISSLLMVEFNLSLWTSCWTVQLTPYRHKRKRDKQPNLLSWKKEEEEFQVFVLCDVAAETGKHSEAQRSMELNIGAGGGGAKLKLATKTKENNNNNNKKDSLHNVPTASSSSFFVSYQFWL